MTVLDEILRDIKEPDLDSKVKQICDKILEDEIKNDRIKNVDLLVKGPNIFLCLPINQKNTLSYLTLERESYSSFIIGVWEIKSYHLDLKTRVKVFEIKKEDDPKKIIRRFAEQYQIMRG